MEERSNALYLDITRNCNNRCIFCHELFFSSDNPQMGLDEIEQKFSHAIDKGLTDLILSGGEPTIHKEFLNIIILAKKKGFLRISVVTNGRMFSYDSLLSKSVEAGMSEVMLSFYSNKKEIYEDLSGIKGSFMQSLSALKNMSRYPKLKKIATIVVNSKNYMFLPASVRFLKVHHIDEIYFASTIPLGRALLNKPLFLKEEEYHAKLIEALDICRENGIKTKLTGFNDSALSEHTDFFDTASSDEFFLAHSAGAGLRKESSCKAFCDFCYGRKICNLTRLDDKK